VANFILLIYREFTEKAKMKLYNYFRSSASYRARIALNLKGIKFEYIPVHLIKNGGEQLKPEYLALNPMGQVPCLEHNGRMIAQTMAIFFYLDEIQQAPPLFPKDAYARAKVIELCEVVNSGIQPLHNTGVLGELTKRFGADQDAKAAWTQHWIQKGLVALEQTVSKTAGKFAVGDEPTAADCFVIPQMFAARRFGAEVSEFKTLLRIEKNANELPAFQLAHPEKQVDYAP
jgi:maleylacetoacetate isomerase